VFLYLFHTIFAKLFLRLVKTYLRILRFIKPYTKEVVLHIIFVAISVILLVSSIALVEPVINLVFKDEPISSMLRSKITNINILGFVTDEIVRKIQDNNGNKMPALMFAILLIVIINIVGNVFRYYSLFFMANVRIKVIRDLRRAVFARVSWLQIAYFEGERKGDIMTRLTNDIQEIENSIVVSFQTIIREPFTIIAFLSVMIVSSFQLTLLVFILLPIAAILITRIGKSLKRNSTRAQSMLSWIMSVIDEFTSGVRVVKAFRAEQYVNDVFNKYNNKYAAFARKQFHRINLIPVISESFGVITIGIFLWFGGRLVFNGHIEAATIVTFVFYFQQIISPAKNLTSAYSNIMKGIASGERVFILYDSPLLIKNPENPIPIKDFDHFIKYENVDFSYNTSLVLRNVCLEISKGKTIAIVGESGSGKTTLVELLFRFYDVKSGKITIDGIDIRDVTLTDLRGLMAIVTQEPILFNDTFFNNIAFGLENVKEEDVIAAAKAANAHDFIMEFPDGYQTNVGDRGGLMSGGQRQRISIARAILKNPPILVLDEATSSLDTVSEMIVQDAIINLMKNRTSIVIAHRISTIQSADKIVVLEKGQIAEMGTHSELITYNGIYHKLVNAQQLSE